MEKARVFCGSFGKEFGELVCRELGIEPGRAVMNVFANGERKPEIAESVRRKAVFFIQSFGGDPNAAWVETWTFMDAALRASAWERYAVLPFMAYQRQDSRGENNRVPVTLRLFGKFTKDAGATAVITSEPHAKQLETAFDIPVDQVFLRKSFVRAFEADDALQEAVRSGRLAVVAPDAGAAQRADAFARKLNSQLVIVTKRRLGPNQSEAISITGDVRNKHCLIVDDMVDTAGTLVHAADMLLDHGASVVEAAMVHPVLSGPAVARINQSKLRRVFVANTIPLTPEVRAERKIAEVNVAHAYAEALKRIMSGDSVSALSK